MATSPSAPPYPGKSPDLISLGDGLNFSAPLAHVDRGTIVSNPLFFLRSNNPPAEVKAADWRVQLEGRVKRPLSIDLAGLRALPSVTQEVWLECAGNSRSRWNPPGEGNQWDDQAISNARFTGVPLVTLLEQAGVESDAVEVVFSGYDRDAQGTPFQRSLPLETARDESVLLAYAMNGEPIPVPNGGPVRLVVPRWAGIASVKWPERIEVVNEPFGGYYNVQRYVMIDEAGQQFGIVREMPVKAVMAWPTEGETLAAGPQHVFGFAWSGHAPIRSVECSADEGVTWSAARLTPGEGPLAWTRWEFEWQVPRTESARLWVRATDSAGNVQPEQARWNKFGYLMNAILKRTVKVR